MLGKINERDYKLILPHAPFSQTGQTAVSAKRPAVSGTCVFTYVVLPIWKLSLFRYKACHPSRLT